MRLTNNLNLPAPIVTAIQRQVGDYDRGESDYSITDLINPPQIVMLKRQFEDEIIEDVSQRIWMLLGSAIHNILEKAGDGADSMGEVRLFAYLNYEEKTISGKFDHLAIDSGTLTDYKVTSSYSVKGDEVKPEWVKQLNYYRWLCMRNDLNVDDLQITAILRDWNQHGLRDENYPRQSVVTMQVPVWDEKFTEHSIKMDLGDHVDAANGVCRPCTDEERWCVPGKIALMKKGRKSAVRLLDTEYELMEYMTKNKFTSEAGYYMVERPTTYRRCEDYCSVSKFCPQWEKTNNEGTN